MGARWAWKAAGRQAADDLMPCFFGTCEHEDAENGAACETFMRERIDVAVAVALTEIEGYLRYCPPLKCPRCATLTQEDERRRCTCIPTCQTRHDSWQKALEACTRPAPGRREG